MATVVGVARPPRLEVPDGIFHVFARGNARQAIFLEAADYESFLELLGRVAERFGWIVLTYCLMENHYHLLVQTPRGNLSRGMRQLNGVYAQRFNRRYGRVGHLFQGRFKAVLVQDDRHLFAECRYIVLNPQRTAQPVEPSDWPWSGHRATLGIAARPRLLAVDRLLGYFGSSPAVARERYRELVEGEGAPRESHPLVNGDAGFVARHLAAVPLDPEFPRRYRVPTPPALAELLAPPTDGAAMLAANRDHGYSMRQIATQLGCGLATVSRRIASQEGAERAVRPAPAAPEQARRARSWTEAGTWKT